MKHESVPQALDTLDEIDVDGTIVIAPILSMAAAVQGAAIQVPVEMMPAGVSSTPNLFTYSEHRAVGDLRPWSREPPTCIPRNGCQGKVCR